MLATNWKPASRPVPPRSPQIEDNLNNQAIPGHYEFRTLRTNRVILLLPFVYCSNTVYLVNTQKNKNKNKNAMARNPRVCPAQNNVWCCAVERSVTLHGSHGSYSSQCGNVGCQALATAKSRTAHRSQCDRCGNRPVLVSLAQLQQHNPLRAEPYP